MENQLVTILRVTTHRLGNFVKNKLEAEGIEIYFINEGLTLGSHYNPEEVLLKVKAVQSEKAIKALLQIHKDYDLDKVAIDQSIVNMKKILLPVKLSDGCVELCRYAMNLAVKTNAEIKLLYVYPDPTFNEPDKHTASWEKHVRIELKEAYNKAQLKLVEFSKKLKNQIPAELYSGSRIHYRMLKGTPISVITDACKRYQPNLVLMGTSESRKEGEFVSKNLVKILENSNIPILAVPISASFKGKAKIDVMYATNFHESDNKSLNKLLEILEPFDKEIYCVHIDLNDDPKHQEKADELNGMLKSEYANYNIKCELVESEDIIKGVDAFVEEKDIDLISLSKIKRSAFYKMFHSDILGKLVSTEKVPILLFSFLN